MSISGKVDPVVRPVAATDIAEYVAQASFQTSDLAVPFERKFTDVAIFAKNLALQRISVDLVFTDLWTGCWNHLLHLY